MIKKYTQRVANVEAVQVSEDNGREVVKWVNEYVDPGDRANLGLHGKVVIAPTGGDGNAEFAAVGDYVVRTYGRIFKVYPADVFTSNFDERED